MTQCSTKCSCRACGSAARFLFDGLMLGQLDVRYFECTGCGYVQTEEPYWLDKAYSRAITASDTGIMVRNQYNACLVLSTLYLLGDINVPVVDYAGGYGILVRMLRDLGVEALWLDKYSENLLASGFEYKSGSANLVTAFEAFEHFVNPVEELSKMLEIAPNVLISTEIIPSPTPLHSDWWYYGPEHGQHIGFFRLETLHKIAAKKGKRLLSDGRSYHLFTDQKLNLFHWRFIRKIISKFPYLLTSRLATKVWTDHLQISRILSNPN